MHVLAIRSFIICVSKLQEKEPLNIA